MDIEKWADEDLWSEDDLRCLCCGIEPGSNREEHLQAINAATEKIRRAVLVGELVPVCPSDATPGDRMYGHDRFFKPRPTMQWATKKFPAFSGVKIKSETKQSIETALGTKERNSLLTIIGVLCNEAKIPYDKPSKAAGMIQSTAATLGVSIGETTIEGHLKKIPYALATRMK